MRKFRALMEPFWDLKICLTCVSMQQILYKLHVTVSDKYIYQWANFMHSLSLHNHVDKNIASLPLYVIIAHHACSVPCHNRSKVRKLYCAVEFVSVIEASKLVKLVAIELVSHSFSASI